MSFPRKWPELNVIAWREEAMVLAVHPSHRVRRPVERPRRRAGWRAVHRLRSRAVDPARHRPVPAAHDVQVEVVLEFDNIENIKRAVEIPSGISILPEPSLAREIKAGTLVAVPIEGEDPDRPSDSPPGDHPPPAREPRSRGGQISRAVDRARRRADETAPDAADAGPGQCVP